MNSRKPRSPAEYSAVIRFPPDGVDDAHDFVASLWERHAEIAEDDRLAVELVVSELISNVIQNNPHRDVLCELTVTVDDAQIAVQSMDTGEVVADSPRTGAMPEETAESGRGLALIEMVTTSMSYERTDGRNVWRAVRARSPRTHP